MSVKLFKYIRSHKRSYSIGFIVILFMVAAMLFGSAGKLDPFIGKLTGAVLPQRVVLNVKVTPPLIHGAYAIFLNNIPVMQFREADGSFSLPPGKYMVNFKPVAGWRTPLNQNVMLVQPGKPVNVTGTYIKTGIACLGGDRSGGDGDYSACIGNTITHQPSGLLAKPLSFDNSTVKLSISGLPGNNVMTLTVYKNGTSQIGGNNGYEVIYKYTANSTSSGVTLNITSKSTVVIPAKCTDGTLYGQCSASKPQYCDNGSLISKCSACGCLSGQSCVNNVCQSQIGCAYNNPSCSTSQNCVNNQCVAKMGCLYGNPSCSASQDCVNNVCQTKAGCAYGNPSCGANQNCLNNACVANIPATPVCGNGKMEAGEQCDDGNNLSTDSCIFNCKIAVCGDGNIQTGVEQCDDGNTMNTDSCLTNCKTATCGDGYSQANFEQCDDGNVINGDGCNAVCKIETSVCGNSKIEAGEQCDDGNKINGDGCNNCKGSLITSNVPKKFLTLIVAHKVDNDLYKYEYMGWEKSLKIRENDNIQIFEVIIWNTINPNKISLYKFDKTFNADQTKYGLGGQDWVNYRESFNILNIDVPKPPASKEYLNAFQQIMKKIVESQPAEHYGIKFFGHGSGDGALFGATILGDDAELLLSYINSIIGEKIDFLDWNTNCGVGTYRVTLSEYQYADYILASDISRGGYEINDESFRLRPTQILETFFSPEKTIRQSLVDMMNTERLSWEEQTAKNDMIAKQIKQSVSIYDTSKFKDLMVSTNLNQALAVCDKIDEISCDALSYIKKYYPAQEQKFYDFRFYYVNNKNFFPWDLDFNGFRIVE